MSKIITGKAFFDLDIPKAIGRTRGGRRWVAR